MRWLPLLLVPLLGCAAAPAPAPPAAAAPACRDGHTVVLVRHAEKSPSGGKDPDLSEPGRARAERLAATLSDAHVTRLVASEYKRTQQTLEPLAAKTKLTVDVRPAGKTDDLARELKDAREGSVAVVASHSDVIPPLVHALGGGTLTGLAPDAGALDHDDFDRLIVLTFGCGAAAPTVVQLRQARDPAK